jgi:hypothetical protein
MMLSKKNGWEIGEVFHRAARGRGKIGSLRREIEKGEEEINGGE